MQRMNVMGAEDGIAKLRDRLDPGNLYLSDFTVDGWVNIAENVAHEVAHAISLGVSLEGSSISEAVDQKARSHSQMFRDYNEGLVLACEVHVLRGLGIRCDYRDLSDAARDQDVSQPFVLFWGTKKAQDLGQRVMRYIGRHLPRRRAIARA